MRTLKLALLAAVATAGFSSAAFAADLIVDTPMVIDNTSSFDWEGPYAGLWVSGQTTPAFGIGANLGVNVLLDTNLLLGVEGELAWLSNNTWQGQFDGRVGFVVDSAVIYGFTGIGANMGTGTGAYVPVGVGVEFGVADNMSIKAEYQYQWDLDNSADDAHVAKIGFNWGF